MASAYDVYAYDDHSSRDCPTDCVSGDASSSSSSQSETASDEGGDWDCVDGFQIGHGDVVQLISIASKVNDGVLTWSAGELTASGRICNRGDACGKEGGEAFFHCHATGETFTKDEVDNWLYLLLPVSMTAEGAFRCPIAAMKQQPAGSAQRTVSVLAVDSPGGVHRLTIKCVDPFKESWKKATDCCWSIVRPSGNPFCSQWRLCADTDRSCGVYAAVDSAGRAYATEDDDLPKDIPNDGLENPHTFFRLYRKFYIDKC